MKDIIYKAIPVEERKPEWASIHVVLLDGRIEMMAQWRPPGEWFTLGMGSAANIESKRKCVTHWLERQ